MNDTLQTGDFVYTEEVDVLPPTTRVSTGGAQWLLKPNGKWTEAHTTTTYGDYETHQLLSSGAKLKIEFIPYPVPRPDPSPVDPDWEALFASVVGAGARDYGLSEQELSRAFEEIGVADAGTVQWRPGMTGWGYGSQVFADLPPGSLVYVARTIYERAEGVTPYFKRRAPQSSDADRNLPAGRWTVLRVGYDGPLEPMEFTVTPEREAEIRAKKARAWRVGMRLKKQKGWCSTLESILQGGGVTASDARLPGLTKLEQRALPEGTLLFWQHAVDDDTWGVVRRSDRMTNTARTEFVFGTNRSNFHTNAGPVFTPGSEWRGIPEWYVQDLGETMTALAALPNHSVVMVGSATYRIMGGAFQLINARSEERRYQPAIRSHTQATYQASQFGADRSSVEILYLPEDAR